MAHLLKIFQLTWDVLEPLFPHLSNGDLPCLSYRIVVGTKDECVWLEDAAAVIIVIVSQNIEIITVCAFQG